MESVPWKYPWVTVLMAVMLELELTSPSNSSTVGADPQALHFHKPLQINAIVLLPSNTI